MGLPQYIAIDRKPEDGCEVQDLCDGEVGVMLRLKLVMSADANDNPAESESEGLNHGTIVLKELLRPWVGSDSRRLVCADSYFASVSTLIELNRLNFAFIGVVKTATKQFPMEYLRAVETLEGRGQRCG